MKGRKVLEFLLLKSVFSSKNLSSLGLVALFFAIYWLAGGRVTVPEVKPGQGFGSVESGSQNGNRRAGPLSREPVAPPVVQPSFKREVGVEIQPKVEPQKPLTVPEAVGSEGESEDATKQLEALEQRLNTIRKNKAESANSH